MKHSPSAETPVATTAGHPPESVRVIRTLGHGRAARAVLVEATFGDGSRRKCVEKVFAPGRLTRLIYRIAFQAPFAYQSNRDAIHACFYRRRVAAAVLAAAGLDVEIAEPLYVRYAPRERAWVLAAAWVDGRGIRPAPAAPQRILGGFAKRLGASAPGETPPAEVDSLVAVMHRLENALVQSGLTGSGWQVAPRALVSTANLLRVGERYMVIDLESGIPAVLVPRYLIDGLRRGELPPFDDLDGQRLSRWFDRQQDRLRDRLGEAATAALQRDIGRLLEHTRQWKNAEPALGRRPWRLFGTPAVSAYQQEFLRRLQQTAAVDRGTAARLPACPGQAALLWWAGWLPGSLGALAQRLIGHRAMRRRYRRVATDAAYRNEQWSGYRQRCRARWLAAGRIPPARGESSTGAFLRDRLLERCSTAPIHRWLVDRQRRRELGTHLILLALSRRYQAWFGEQQIASSIERWRQSGRIDAAEAARLRAELSAEQVRVYARGFGMHLALKALAPVVTPAKVGGAAAFLASGQLWFLLPMLLTPLLRTAVTLTSLLGTARGARIPHGEALLAGMLPMIGSLAFPLQMFSTRRPLSIFLIRETASKVGRRLPVYGGADSRTEIALIRLSDWLIAALTLATAALSRRRRAAETSSEAAAQAKRADAAQDTAIVAGRLPVTRLGRWLERETSRRLDRRSDSQPRIGSDPHTRPATVDAVANRPERRAA